MSSKTIHLSVDRVKPASQQGILGDVWLRPCLFRSSRCLGLQDKHNIHVEVLGGNGVGPLHGDDAQPTSPCPLLRLMMLATTPVTPAQFIVKNRLPHNGELRLRQFYRAVCTIHKWIGGAENRQHCSVLGLNMQSTQSLNNLHVGNQLITALHYLRACTYIIFSNT